MPTAHGPPQPEQTPTRPTPPDVPGLEGIRADVGAALRTSVAGLKTDLAALHDEMTPIAGTIGELLAGGKRLRAAFCYWSWRAHRRDDRPAANRDDVIRAGAAVELFQAGTLLHDDVIDDSGTRRGNPTAHRVFTARHRAEARSGNAEAFGRASAVLAGDYAFAASQRELEAAVATAPRAIADSARDIMALMAAETAAGQFLELQLQTRRWAQDHADHVDDVRAVIRSKSARYSVQYPLALGAALAGADDPIERVAAFGLPIGEAFQLRDDVLGIFGDPAVTGKPAGDDLREGKPTLLMAYALERADPDQRALLVGALGDPDLAGPRLDRVREALVQTGALAQVEAEIESLTTDALRALHQAGFAGPGRAALSTLARAAVARST